MHYHILIVGNGLETLRRAVALSADGQRVLLVEDETAPSGFPWEALQVTDPTVPEQRICRWRDLVNEVSAKASRLYGVLDAALFERRVERCTGEIDYSANGELILVTGDARERLTTDQIVIMTDSDWETPSWGGTVGNRLWTPDDLFHEADPPMRLLTVGAKDEVRAISHWLRRTGREVVELADENFDGEVEDRLLFVRQRSSDVEAALTDGTTHRADGIVYCRWSRMSPMSATVSPRRSFAVESQADEIDADEPAGLRIYQPAKSLSPATCAP